MSLNSTALHEPTYIGDLGNGLIRRWSTEADQEKIARLAGTVFRHNTVEEVNVRAVDEIRFTMTSIYPFMGPGDYAVVEDTSQAHSPFVACSGYWRHQWSYGGIPFGVGRPEPVATDAAYRKRGLVRALFEMVHARSTAEGHLAQAITGIAYFYRQFGYEYVLDLDGCKAVYTATIPEKSPEKSNDTPRFSLRHATLDDIPALMALYNQRRDASLVWHEASEAYWRYQVASWDDPAIQGRDLTEIGLYSRLHMLLDSNQRVCGYLKLPTRRAGRGLPVFAMELDDQTNWHAALTDLLPTLRDYGQQLPTFGKEPGALSEIRFDFGRSHPSYSVLDTILGGRLPTRIDPPYAWYLRVPDIAAFILRIAPALEARLANSPLTGYSGELSIDFYRYALLLKFEEGKLTHTDPAHGPAGNDDMNVSCSPLHFLQLLFGYRSHSELRAMFPDFIVNREVRLLVDTLFPALPSTVHPLL
jgi:hypothetical protein